MIYGKPKHKAHKYNFFHCSWVLMMANSFLRQKRDYGCIKYDEQSADDKMKGISV